MFEAEAGQTGCAPSPRSETFVSIAVPTLNEQTHIRACLASLLVQLDPKASEILVLDGGSRDATRAIVAQIARDHPTVRLVDNPARIQAAAINLAARTASPQADVLIRADAHADYPPNFVAEVVAALQARNAASAVVPMRTVGEKAFQRAVAAVQGSFLGNGGSAHRRGGPSRWVDHGHHAAFDRSVFLRLGGYDESFTHNEDAEYDHRLRSAGFRIWMCRAAAISYFPRERPTALARQYYNHGRGRGRTVMRHRIRPALRQLAPPAALLGSTGGLALAPLEPLFLAIPAAYLALCHAFAIALAARRRDPALLAAGIAATIMHFAWSAGFLRSVAGGFSIARPPASAHLDARPGDGPGVRPDRL
ncbi:glycosyltransferase family 2 protein [Salinarimonas sp.]|uniref:glycosyltransferase family 2 protein n=1 Tax=Salinarimonas sp. TaxID=2766526 RepID=UPI0032D979F5